MPIYADYLQCTYAIRIYEPFLTQFRTRSRILRAGFSRFRAMFKNGLGSDLVCNFLNQGSKIERNSFSLCLKIFGLCSEFEPKFKNSSIQIQYALEYCWRNDFISFYYCPNARFQNCERAILLIFPSETFTVYA